MYLTAAEFAKSASSRDIENPPSPLQPRNLPEELTRLGYIETVFLVDAHYSVERNIANSFQLSVSFICLCKQCSLQYGVRIVVPSYTCMSLH